MAPPRPLPNAVSKPDRLHLHTRLSPRVSSPCESTAGDLFPLANLSALRADPVHTSGRRRVHGESRTVSNLLPPTVSPSLSADRPVALPRSRAGGSRKQTSSAVQPLLSVADVGVCPGVASRNEQKALSEQGPQAIGVR